MFIRALFGVAAVFVVALTYQTPVQAQNRIEDRFANVNRVRLHLSSASSVGAECL